VIPRPIPTPIIGMLKREIEIQAFLGEGHLNIINAYEVRN
jgi:serine/threonine-protein kinase SRK2